MLKINELARLYLGVKGENNSRTIEIDMSAWAQIYPNATAVILHKRNGDQAKDLTGATYDSETKVLSWETSSYDTFYDGFGVAEIRMVEGDVVKKTKDMITTVTASSLTNGSGQIVESTWQAFLNDVIATKGEAEAAQIAAEAAQEAAEEAQEKAEDAVTHAPYVDSTTGNWMVWDWTAEDYIDTGVHAKGDKGDKGDPGSTSIDDTTTASNKLWSSSKTNTEISAKYTKPGTGIPVTDLASAVQTSLEKADSAYQKPGTGIPGTDIESGVIPVLTDLIDDTAGAGDTDKVFSANKLTSDFSDVLSALSSKYEKPSGGIPSTDLASGVTTSLGKADTAYQKPSGGIPASDIADGVIPSLDPQDVADAVSDWCNENITEDPTVVIDKSLSVAGAAADAAETGKINKTVFGTHTEHTITQSELELGTWAYSSKSTNSKRLRISQLNPITKGTVIRYTNPTLKLYFGVLATTSSSSYLENTGWIEAGKTDYSYEIQNNGYLVLIIEGSSGIAVTDYNCTITLITTTTKGVLDPSRMPMMLPNNAYPMHPNITDTESKTVSGITRYTRNGVTTFSGTASADTVTNMAGSATNMLDFEAGKEYFVMINKTGTGDIYIVLSLYNTSGTFIKDVLNSRENTSFVIDSLTGVGGMILRYRVKKNAVVDCSISYTISEVPSSSYLSDKVSMLAGKYAKPLYKDTVDKSESTNRGITYSITNGTAKFSGTSQSSGVDFRANRIGWNDIMLTDFEVGKKYFISLNKTGTGKAGVELSLYDSNGTHIGDAFDAYEDTSFVINSLTGVSGMLIRYHIPQGETVNCTISYTISEVPSNAYLLNRKTVFSIMQYNIGKYTWGNASMHITTEETGSHLSFDEYVANYRKFLCKYHPDIIGIEEYLPTTNVEVSGSSPTEYETESMKELIFDPVYPFDSEFVEIDDGETVHRQRCLKSKIGKPVDVSYEWDSVTINGETSYMPSVVAHYNIDGKRVCCVCHGMPWVHGDAYVTARNTLLSSVLDKFADEEYCFIALDMNNGGNDSTVTSKDEAESLLQMAQTKGWNFAMGGYLPFEKTYVPNTPSEHYNNLMLDNIIYKDNGKTILRDFKVLMDEYENLSSDHVPVIGEFILL